MKRILPDEKDLQHKLNYLEPSFVDKAYNARVARPEIRRVNSISNVLLEKHPKHHKYSVILILTFHPVLHVIFDILKYVNHHIEKLILQKSLRVAFRNPKSLRDKLV